MKRKKNKPKKLKAFREQSVPVLPDINPNYLVLFGIFLISLSVISLEISITRISSIIYTYNYAFMAVSLAILGLGLGGVFSYYRWSSRRLLPAEYIYNRLSFFSALFAVSTFIFLILILKIPLFTNLYLYFAVTFIPFFFAGIVLSLAFKLFAGSSFKLYFFDLIGAALGALAVIFILDLIGGVNAIIAISIAGVLASFLFLKNRYSQKINLKNLGLASAVAVILLLMLILNIFTGFLGEVPIRRSEIKDMYFLVDEPGSNGEVIDTRWSAFGRTDLVGLEDNDNVRFLFIDGAAGTPMFKFDGDLDAAYENLDFLKMIFSGTFPFNFLDEEQKDDMLIVGPGGGREIIIGLVNGIDNITGVEINRDFVEIVKDNKDYNGGIYTDFDNVDIITAEGRSYLESIDDSFDIILIIQPFTKSSRSVEGYALTENYLLTAEAIKAYLDHLSEEGVIVMVLHNTNEILRFITSSLLVLEEMGVSNEEAMSYFYTVGKEINPVIVLGKKPFTADKMEEVFQGMLATGLVSPLTYIPALGQRVVTARMEDGTATNIEVFNDELLALAEGRMDLQDLIDSTPFNAKPATDNRPFFFKDEKGIPQDLISILVITLLVNLAVIIASFIHTGNQRQVRGLLGLAMLLGFGFIMIEISFFQKFILYLGSPIYSLAIILGVLLAGMGIGSLAGSRILVDQERKKIYIFCFATAALTVALFFILSSLSGLILGYSFSIRLLITALFLLPVGFLMGIPFPSAIRLARSYESSDFVPWMYGINGTMSVLGSVATIAVSTVFGFTSALVIGAVCYVLTAVIFLLRKS